MTLALDDGNVEMKKRPCFGDQLHGITVRPVRRGSVLPERLQLAEATGVPRTDNPGRDATDDVALRPMGVAEHAVSRDLVHGRGDRVFRRAHTVKEKALPALDDSGNGQIVVKFALPIVTDASFLQAQPKLWRQQPP